MVGVILDGLTNCGPGIDMAPIIYLNPYYEQFKLGMNMEEVLADILKLYRSTPAPDCLKEADLSQFEALKSRIMFRIVPVSYTHLLFHQSLVKAVGLPVILIIDPFSQNMMERNIDDHMIDAQFKRIRHHAVRILDQKPLLGLSVLRCV